MGKHKNSVWAQEVQYDEVNYEAHEHETPENLLTGAYEALNRFCQKEKQRSKNPKRRKQCWQ